MARLKKQKKNKRNALRQKKFLLSRDIRRKIWGVACGLIALIIVLSFFGLAGIGGRGFQTLFNFLLGKTVFCLPLFFLIASLMFFNPRLRNNWLPVLVILMFSLALSAIFTLLSKIYFAFSGLAGGVIGHFIIFPFQKFFGPWVSLLIFSALLIVAGLIAFHILRPESKDKEEDLSEAGADIAASAFSDEPGEHTSLLKKIFSPKFRVRPIEPQIEKGAVQSSKKAGPELTEDKPSFKFKYQPPPLTLLEQDKGLPSPGDIKMNSAVIKKSLQNFDIPVEMSEVNVGPTVTQYTFKPADGIKLAKITALNNDLALALASHPIRIEAPIPGKSLVGLEMPNKQRVTVRFRNLLEKALFEEDSAGLWLAFGRDVAGAPFFADLTKMPHLLIAGATGTGKTICLNSVILSLLYQQGPEALRLILVDPKRVEFSVYQELPHLLCPVIFEPQKTINVLKWLIGEMERRFELLSQVKTRDIGSFNRLAAKKHFSPLPFIVLIIDELADLMAARGKEVEAGIIRLAQMARAVGIHLVVATQRPSVEVITGLIKANITSRISFRVASQVDSRTVLDVSGSEKLLGFGDMLFLSPETKKPKRLQGVYVSEKEIKNVVAYLEKQPKDAEFPETALPELPLISEDNLQKSKDLSLKNSLEQALKNEPQNEVFGEGTQEDPLYEEAKRIIRKAKKASASLLQRHLRIGYARAARLLDTLEAAGIVGPSEGAKPREVYGQSEDGNPDPPDEISKDEG